MRAKIFALLLEPTGFGVVATIDPLMLSAVHITNLNLAFFFSLGALPVLLLPGLALTILFSAEFVSTPYVLVWVVAWQFLYK